MSDKTSPLLRQFFLGFIKVHILHHAARQPVYGLWLIGELGWHGYRISPGTLYPLLRGMELGGLLAVERLVVSGRMRKYYTATAAGLLALDEIRERVRELVGEVLQGQEDRG